MQNFSGKIVFPGKVPVTIYRTFETEFNKALKFGLGHIDKGLKTEQSYYPNVNIKEYFINNISFELDLEKRAGMAKFLELASKLEFVELK